MLVPQNHLFFVKSFFKGRNCIDELRRIYNNQYTGVCQGIVKSTGKPCGDFTSDNNKFCEKHRADRAKEPKKPDKPNEVKCDGHIELKSGVWTKTPCKFLPQKDSLYCGKHEANGKRYQDSLKGIRYCNGYIRGCRTEMPNGSGKYCEKCLEIDREKEKQRNAKKLETHKQQVQDNSLANIVCGTFASQTRTVD